MIRTMRTRIQRMVLALLIFATLPGCFTRTVYVPAAPPAARVDVRPARPYASAVWVPGHYVWRRGRYVWATGHWQKKRHGYVWISGRWVHTRRGWVWKKGRWVKK